jgi:hypothetical protein
MIEITKSMTFERPLLRKADVRIPTFENSLLGGQSTPGSGH